MSIMILFLQHLYLISLNSLKNFEQIQSHTKYGEINLQLLTGFNLQRMDKEIKDVLWVLAFFHCLLSSGL